MYSLNKPLIVGTLPSRGSARCVSRPVTVDLRNTAEELKAALAALDDVRSIQERTLDSVVDRLLVELSDD